MKTLITNAIIYSMDKKNSVYNSMIVENENITLLGEYKDLKKYISNNDIIWDLEGKTVIPGLTDAHIHFLEYSLLLTQISLRRVKSIKDCAEHVRKKAEEIQPGEWITGGGWDKNLWGGYFPTKDILDKASPKNPVFLISKDCHTAWVNSIALKKAGINENTPNMEGGEIEKANNIPTGILKENAQSLVRSIIPYPNEDIIRKALLEGIQKTHSLGFTAVHCMSLQNDTSFCVFLEALKQIRRRDLLTLRFTLNPTLKIMNKIIDSGLEKKFGDAFLKFGAIKIFVDGSLGSQSAWTIDDYCGHTDCKGISIEHGQKLEENIRKSISLGFPVAVHAIGDRANREILDVLNKYHGISVKKGLRHRIEHAQLLNPKDLDRFSALGVIASVQPIHLLEDMDLIMKFWGERGRWAYPFNSLIKNGTIMTFGSDAPVEDLNPFIGIYAAVKRQRKRDEKVFYNQEKISVYDALKAYTWGPAYASKDDNIRGTLEADKKADFVVINKDIFNINPDEIPDIKVESTIVDGNKVYERKKGISHY